MRIHVSILAWFMIVLHSMFALLGLVMVLFGSSFVALIGNAFKDLIPTARFAPFFWVVGASFILSLGIAGIAVGLGLLNSVFWSRKGAIIVCILEILTLLPFSVLLGIYGLILMSNPESRIILSGEPINLSRHAGQDA